MIALLMAGVDVLGLLAETAAGERLTERQCAQIRTLHAKVGANPINVNGVNVTAGLLSLYDRLERQEQGNLPSRLVVCDIDVLSLIFTCKQADRLSDEQAGQIRTLNQWGRHAGIEAFGVDIRHELEMLDLRLAAERGWDG